MTQPLTEIRKDLYCLEQCLTELLYGTLFDLQHLAATLLL